MSGQLRRGAYGTKCWNGAACLQLRKGAAEMA